MRKNYWNLSVGVIANLVKRVLEISAKPVYVNLVGSSAFLRKLTSLNSAYSLLIDKPGYSGLGKQLLAADVLRDKRFLGMKKALRGFIQMDGIANHDDAVKLYALFEKHGIELYHYSYGDETTHLNQLLLDLEQPENVARLQRLNMMEAFTLLKDAQTAFESILNSQTEEDSELRGMESASSMYKNMAVALRNYMNYVDNMSELDGNWTAFSLELNEALKAANVEEAAAKTTTDTETK